MSSHTSSPHPLPRRLAWPAALAGLVAAVFTVVQAQEEPAAEPAPASQEAAPAAEAQAAPAPAEASPGLEGIEQPEVPPPAPVGKAKDGDAEIMPLAAKSLLLDVEDTGAGLIAVGERGHILLSQDGRKWTQSPVPTRATLTAIDCADASTCWAVGHDAVILKTSDGGKTWVKQYFEPELEKPFLDVLFFDTQHGFVIGAYGLFKETLDGGNTWNEFNTDIRAGEWHFNAITRLGNGNLLLVGETGGIATSTDGGVTWVQQESPYEGSYFGALPIGESGAVIFGLRGNAFISADAAKGGWTQLETGTVQGLLGGTILPNGDFVLAGNSATLLRGSPSTNLIQRVPGAMGKGLATALAMSNGDLLVLGETGSYVLKGAAQ
ncbi:MAG TPA: YCF48-related protein [Nevskiales bacterium]|nr:YCF48-related protein [Nevskiales bacterium]